MTDAQMYEILGWSYEPCYTTVFNQDGEMLYPDAEIAGQARFVVQGKEINTLYIYIFNHPDDQIQMETQGMNGSAASGAVIFKEIPVR